MDQRLVSRNSPLPLYHQLLELLEKELAAGKYPPGSKFPSESELIGRFGVSRATVRRALRELELHGLVNRVQGQGTFVRSQRIEQELTALTGFVEDMLEINYRPSARVIKIEQVNLDNQVSQMLDLPSGSPATYIERVRLANSVPLSFDVTWLPNPIGEQIAQENLVLFPIFSLLEDRLDIQLDHATYRIESVLAQKRVAQYLEIKSGAPILAIERTAFSTDGKPVDHEILHYRGDSIRLSMKLERKQPPWKLEDLEKMKKD
ncbi:MAG: GntR family transcriptional regulator [Anaerolineales bacterium]|nr:GntR family transcriptional regulator [Anaerolineales bacterium]